MDPIILVQRTQSVNVKCTDSNRRLVKSGLPQGTVLGLLFVLAFVNDINKTPPPELNLADNNFLYKEIIKTSDFVIFQKKKYRRSSTVERK